MNDGKKISSRQEIRFTLTQSLAARQRCHTGPNLRLTHLGKQIKLPKEKLMPAVTMGCVPVPVENMLLGADTDAFASSPLSGPIIALYAGRDNVPFYVHANVMCANSFYFHNHFGGPNVPPERDLHLHFPDINPADMTTFTSYMYRLFWKEYDLNISTSPNEDIIDHVRLYLTGCIFGVPFLRERVLGAVSYLLEKEDKAYILGMGPKEFEVYLQNRMSLVRLVYRNTNEGDILRRHFVKSMGLHSDLYYEYGMKHSIDMDANMESFFKLVPVFSDDLRVFLSRGKEFAQPTDEEPVEEKEEEHQEVHSILATPRV